MIQVKRHFNIAGLCVPAWHYMLDPLARIADAPRLIDQGGYGTAMYDRLAEGRIQASR